MFFSESGLFRNLRPSGHQLVPCSVWPARCAQRWAPRGRTVLADLSQRAPGSAFGLAIQASPRAGRRYPMNRGPGFAATGGLLAGARGRLSRGWRTRQGARHRVRGAGRSAPSTPWTGRTISARGPPGSQSPGRHAACLCAVFFLGVSARPPPGPPLSRRRRLTSSGSRGARERAAQVQRKYCRHRTQRPGPSKQPAPSLPPEPGALALPNYGQLLSDCTIFYAAHPGPRRRLTRQRAESSVLASASHNQAPCALWSPRGMGRRWGREARSLAFPSLPPPAAAAPGRRGLGSCWGAGAEAAPAGLGKAPGPGAGAGGSHCCARSLGRWALQPGLKPTAENTERAALS